MLFCLQCCERCLICLDRFAREDSADVADGAPLRCEWSQSGSVQIVDQRVRIDTGGQLHGPAGQRVEVTLRANATGAIAEIAFGEVTGVVIFGSPGYIVPTGGVLGFALKTCSLATGVDHTFFLCLGALEADPEQLAAQFGLLEDVDCVVGDTIDDVAGRTLSIRSVAGLVEVDDIKVERVLSEEYPTCPECVPAPPDPECLVCRDHFNRADNSDVTVGQTCTWIDSGAAAVAGNWLSLPAGATITGPSCDYVSFTTRSNSADAKLTVMIGTVGVTIAFGAAESTMTIISPSGGGTTTITMPTLTSGSSGNTFVLCIGLVDKRAGILCFNTADPSRQVSGQMGDNPASPFGAVSFSSTGIFGTVEVDGVSLFSRRTVENEHCTTCHPNLCAICADFSPVFATSDCGWVNAGGFGYAGADWLAAGTFATAISGVGNPDGRPPMILGAGWDWTSAIDSDTVRMRVAALAGSGPYIELTKGGYYNGAGCMRLYSSSNALLSTVSSSGGNTVAVLLCDGVGVWVNGPDLTRNDMLGRNNLVLPGAQATLGTGSSFDASSYVTFGLMSIDWYAAAPWHKQCATSYRDCAIFSVAFPTGGGSEAGDPGDVVNCHVDYTASSWSADFFNGWWATQANGARITILTNHPDSGAPFTAVITWTVSVVTPESVDFAEINGTYPGLQLLFQHSGTAIVVEFLGWTDGGLKNVWLWKISFNGGSGIAASAGPDAFAPIPHGMTACFGSARSRLSFAQLGFRDVVGPATGNGTGIGIQSGPSLYGPEDATLFVEGIAMQHAKTTTPNNGFSGVAPPVCTDCDENHCPPCEDNTPVSLTVTIAPKVGADLSALCAADIAVLSNTYVLGSHLTDCQYSIYLGPTNEAAVPGYVEFIHTFDNESNCANFLGIKAEMSFDGSNVRITVTVIGITGVFIGWLDPAWSGTMNVNAFDCESFSLALGQELGSFSNLFEVTVEYN